jgi:hypothetical protein
MTTKADRIRQLAQEHPDWKTGRIGKACNCRPEYVRVVLRQRVGGGTSEADRRYRASPLGQTTRMKQRAVYEAGDKSAASKAARAAYKRARSGGCTREEAMNFAWTARRAAMVKTGRKKSNPTHGVMVHAGEASP